MSRKVRKPKQSAAAKHSLLIQRNNRDHSTYEVMRHLTIVYSTIQDTEREVNRLQSKMKELRVRLSADRAEAQGLESILESRQ